MNPFYPEKTDGKPIQLNDRIRLEDGTSVTIREFLQMPGLGGGLTFGQISLGNLEFVNPPGWAPGNVYEITSPGDLYGQTFVTGDFAMVVSDTQVVPLRVGDVLSRLEIVDIIDERIASEQVQESISSTVQTLFNGMLVPGPDSDLKQFVYDNARSDLHITQYPDYGTYYINYDGPSKIFIPESIEHITIDLRIPELSEQQRSFRIVIARSEPGSNRELSFNVRDAEGNYRFIEFGGDLPVIGNSANYVQFSIPSEKAAIIDVDVWPEYSKAYVVGTLMGNSGLDY